MSEQDRPRLDIRDYRNSFLGIGLLVCVAFMIFGSWPLYGAAGALPQAALWLVLLVQACRWFQSRPTGVLALGGLALAVWIGVVLLNRL